MFLDIVKGLVSFFRGTPPDQPKPVEQPSQQRPHRVDTDRPAAPAPIRHDQSHPPRGKPANEPIQLPHKRRPENHVNQLNQQNERYVNLRGRANKEGDSMAQCYQQSHEAYARREGALAKELSEKGKVHKSNMERLNAEASEWIFKENNLDNQTDEIDLHGLYVKEAISFTDRAIQQARRNGDSQIRLIVGKGLHSPQNVAKIKPAMEELIQKHHLLAEVDPNNAGVLIVYLDTQQRKVETHGKVIGTDDIARRLQEKDNGCIIM